MKVIRCSRVIKLVFSPPIPTRKKLAKNPWEMVKKEPDIMCRSLPSTILSQYLNTDDNNESCSSNQEIPLVPEVPPRLHFTLPLTSTINSDKKQGHHLSDPSLLISCKNSTKSSSTVSFTFQQYNLSFTPESTV